MSRTMCTLASIGLALLSCQSGPPLTRTEVTFDFGQIAPGGLPPGWRAAETNGRGTPGEWRVDAESGGQKVLKLARTSNAEDTFNVVLLPETFPADVTLSVRIRADSGREDRGGGLVWRAGGADDYYVARWNPLEDNVRAYRVVGGHRTMIATADVTADHAGWHVLRVSARGASVLVELDGVEMLSYSDTTFGGPGAVGVWTKADAATSFDDLRVTPARS